MDNQSIGPVLEFAKYLIERYDLDLQDALATISHVSECFFNNNEDDGNFPSSVIEFHGE